RSSVSARSYCFLPRAKRWRSARSLALSSRGPSETLERPCETFQRLVYYRIVVGRRDEPGAALEDPHPALEEPGGKANVAGAVGRDDVAIVARRLLQAEADMENLGEARDGRRNAGGL